MSKENKKEERNRNSEIVKRVFNVTSSNGPWCLVLEHEWCL